MATNKKVITIGLSSIEYAPIPADGSLATTGWKTFGYTAEGSCSFSTEDGDKTEIMVEEIDTPVFVDAKPGKQTFEFAVADPGLETLKELFGGEIKTTGGKEAWHHPRSVENKEVALRVTSRRGLTFEVARALLSPKLNGSFARGELFKVEVSAQVLTPTKADVAPLVVSEKA